MEKEHQETIHQPAAEPVSVPEVIEEGEEETKEETEESIYNNKLKTLKAKLGIEINIPHNMNRYLEFV